MNKADLLEGIKPARHRNMTFRDHHRHDRAAQRRPIRLHHAADYEEWACCWKHNSGSRNLATSSGNFGRHPRACHASLILQMNGAGRVRSFDALADLFNSLAVPGLIDPFGQPPGQRGKDDHLGRSLCRRRAAQGSEPRSESGPCP